ncbi:tetratricopeptide repeat protein 21A isoform X18 [Pan paniscus]|uniref:tetratricopeptide repeat protein 21A isoform X18 n=1 Tax=Pan paniscus TaxID=9597 RepID=UPI0030045F3B
MAAAPLGTQVQSRCAYPDRPGASSADSLSRRSIPAPCDVRRFVPPTPDTDAPSNRLAARFPRTVTPSTARRDRVPTTLPRESRSAPPHQTRTRSRERPEMSSNDSSLMAGIIYYSQEKYFHHVQQAAAVGLEKFSNDPVLKFFKAYGVLKEEHIQDAISDLESIRHHPDVSLCSTMALIYAHKRCEIIDREAIQELEYSLKEIRKTVSGTALYYAGLFLWLIGRHDKAKEYIDRMLKISRGFREAYVLRGWVDLTSDKPHTAKKAIEYLEQGIQDTKDVLGLMGKAMYFMMQQNYSEALEVVNQITVTSGSFLPALVLKMQLFLARQDWEQTVEMGHRILEKDESNIDACQILTVHELAREGNMTTATNHVRNLIKALETREPENPSLHLKKIIVVSRLCGSHQVILGLVCSFIERTFMATPSYVHVATELGYLFILKNQVKEALRWYSEAMKLDKDGMAGLTGIILCHILEGHLEEAEYRLEFLKEVQKSLGKSEVLIFLQALLMSRKHKGEEETTALLKEAVELHFSSMQGIPLGSEYFEKLDPYFLVCIAKEYLLFCPKQPRLPGQIVSPLLKQVAVILNPVVKAAPALIDPLYLMAQVRYYSGELENAQSILQRCLELDPASVDAHLLMCQIYLAQGNFGMCFHCLELGVSHNFQHEATKVMQDTINEFGGTPEENRITIANVDLVLSKGNVDVALNMLRNILPKQSCYMEAREKMANIYLQTLRDRRLYIRCYRELCEHLPGPHTSLLLGDALMSILEALDLQSRILKRVPLEQPEMIPSQKQLAASICIQFAEHYLAEKEYDKAVRSYKDVFSYLPTDNKVMLELAQLYLLQGHLDLCEQHCAILLQTEQNHETASVLMADLMFRKQKHEAAINLYHQVLEKAPDNFLVLNKLIDLLRRSGKLEDIPAFFELAKKVSSRVPLEPGFNYCRGIYCWHIGQPNEALKFLNKARKDSTWGQSAIYHMVQICLNPDNEVVGGEAFENQGAESNYMEKKELEQQGVSTAEKLLREFYPHSDSSQTQLRLLQGLCRLATREKANMEAALGSFIQIAQVEKDSVPALLALAQAYVFLKQIPKARMQLKRLAKTPWVLSEAEDLEKSWLLLADIYCQGSKFDLALELLRRCVQYNKSCYKAYEYMGFIMEKEQSYKDAVTNYKLAWKYSHHANPAIGFKLAFNYLKDKKFVEAIEICNDVLREHPDYPKIREEILEKARRSLRP